MNAKRRFISVLIIAAILFTAMGLIYFIGHPVMVIGSSMKPTYSGGEILFTKVSFDRDDIKEGSIIVFRRKGKRYIKRVVGLPGEAVEVKKDGVYINGMFHKDDFGEINNTYPEIVLGEDEYFALGDNRNNSEDSRELGPVSFDEITNIVR